MENRNNKTVFHLKKFEKSYGYAQAVKAGNLLYISGTVSIDDDGNPVGADNMQLQVSNIYEDISLTLQAFGLGFDNVVKEAVFSTDLDRFKREGLGVRAKYYSGLSLPASSAWIQVVQLAFPEYLIEIEAIAAFPD